MLGVLFWIGIWILVCVWIYKNTYWFKSIEDTSAKYSDKFYQLYVDNNKSTNSFSKETAEHLKKLSENFNHSYDSYLHLRERFKHNEKGKQVEKDWKDYLRETRIVLNWHESKHYVPDESGGNRYYKAQVVMDEIDERFKKLLKD